MIQIDTAEDKLREECGVFGIFGPGTKISNAACVALYDSRLSFFSISSICFSSSKRASNMVSVFSYSFKCVCFSLIES